MNQKEHLFSLIRQKGLCEVEAAFCLAVDGPENGCALTRVCGDATGLYIRKGRYDRAVAKIYELYGADALFEVLI